MEWETSLRKIVWHFGVVTTVPFVNDSVSGNIVRIRDVIDQRRLWPPPVRVPAKPVLGEAASSSGPAASSSGPAASASGLAASASGGIAAGDGLEMWEDDADPLDVLDLCEEDELEEFGDTLATEAETVAELLALEAAAQKSKKKIPDPPVPPEADGAAGAAVADTVAVVDTVEDKLARVETKGANIRLDGDVIGKITYMIQWDPPSISCQCSKHSPCSITANILKVEPDVMKRWLVEGLSLDSAEEHRTNRPDLTYSKRLLLGKSLKGPK